MMNAAYHYLDLTPLGRHEDGLPYPMDWVRLRDPIPAGAGSGILLSQLSVIASEAKQSNRAAKKVDCSHGECVCQG